MALDIETIRSVITSHSLASGFYEATPEYEPKSRLPGGGLVAAVLLGDIDPLPGGLALTSARIEFIHRTHLNMVTKPEDDIDIRCGAAVNAMLTALIGDFTLGGNVREIDILGEFGPKLRARPGYISLGGPMYRVIDLFIPCVVDNCWTQTA